MSDISKIQCIKCAGCCKHYPFIGLSERELNLIANYTTLDIDRFAESKEQTVGSYFLKFNQNGDCYFLKHKDDLYSCAIYEIRPRICRDYPHTDIQSEYCSEKINNTCSK
jgi:Fe-S-cluster containining protein